MGDMLGNSVESAAPGSLRARADLLDTREVLSSERRSSEGSGLISSGLKEIQTDFLL